jgi:hypothetical protein
MNAVRCQTPPSALAVMPNADYSDSYQIEVPGSLSPIDVAKCAVADGPRWVGSLMALRNAIAGPLGLKTGREHMPEPTHFVGFFPVITSQPAQAVLGLDDRHLDFRLVVETSPLPGGRAKAILTTVVRRHNLLGRIYLAAILPFHRLIVPAMLARATGAS